MVSAAAAAALAASPMALGLDEQVVPGAPIRNRNRAPALPRQASDLD